MTARAARVAEMRAKIAALREHDRAGHGGKLENCVECRRRNVGFVPVEEALDAAVEDVRAGRADRRRP